MQLELLCRALVDAIRASDPSRLHQPHRLRDMQHRLAPYRAVRHDMALACSEDYEMLLLRLVAGERGYATVEREAGEVFRKEVGGVNPDLGLLEVYGDIEVRLTDAAIAASLSEPVPGAAYRPPDTEPPEEPEEATVIPLVPAADLPQPPPIPVPTPLEAPPIDPPQDIEPAAPPAPPFELSPTVPLEHPETDACPYCGDSLPANRRASFCPHCGQNLNAIRCARCDEELEFGWRHCIGCGHPVPGD